MIGENLTFVNLRTHSVHPVGCPTEPTEPVSLGPMFLLCEEQRSEERVRSVHIGRHELTLPSTCRARSQDERLSACLTLITQACAQRSTLPAANYPRRAISKIVRVVSE